MNDHATSKALIMNVALQ